MMWFIIPGLTLGDCLPCEFPSRISIRSQEWSNTKDQRYSPQGEWFGLGRRAWWHIVFYFQTKVGFEQVLKHVCIVQSFATSWTDSAFFHCLSKMFQDQPWKPLWHTFHLTSVCINTVSGKPLEWGKMLHIPKNPLIEATKNVWEFR